MRLQVVCLWAIAAVLAIPRTQASTGIVDEVKLGLLAHDVPIGGDSKESSADVNGEVLFVSPSFLAPIFAPRPNLGAEINTASGNSYAYAGLSWLVNLGDAFADLGLGGAIHDRPNEVSITETDRKGLGTRLLFHEQVDVGYRLTPRLSLALYLDHVSNADVGRHNPGLTNMGARVGYSF